MRKTPPFYFIMLSNNPFLFLAISRQKNTQWTIFLNKEKNSRNERAEDICFSVFPELLRVPAVSTPQELLVTSAFPVCGEFLPQGIQTGSLGTGAVVSVSFPAGSRSSSRIWESCPWCVGPGAAGASSCILGRNNFSVRWHLNGVGFAGKTQSGAGKGKGGEPRCVGQRDPVLQSPLLSPVSDTHGYLWLSRSCLQYQHPEAAKGNVNIHWPQRKIFKWWTAIGITCLHGGFCAASLPISIGVGSC